MNRNKRMSSLIKSFIFIIPNKKTLKEISMTSKSLKTSQEIERLAQSSRIGYFGSLPNELIVNILENLSLEELSLIAITNKSFRDLIIDFFIKSNTGFRNMLSETYDSTNANTIERQEKRTQTFKSLGLLLKRSTCLYPTNERMILLIQLFNKLDGIPTLISDQNSTELRLSSNDILNMRFVFQCYGQLVHKLIAGWDDSECKFVFKVIQSVTHIEQLIKKVMANALGARQTIEYYIRCFYRQIFIDPIDRSVCFKDRLFWLTRILKPYGLTERAKLLVIIFGPLISLTPSPGSLPYIGWWDLTDTFFIQSGLEELGFAIHLLYTHHKEDDIWNKQNVISLFQTIIKLPENWLNENIATLLYFSGDDITQQFFVTKLLCAEYSEVAQYIVYLTLITYKLTNDTNSIVDLIEKLATNEHKASLINELPIAFTEAITDIDNLIELEDERDVTELHEMISAQSHLMKSLMIRTFSSKSLQIDSNSEKFESSHESKPTPHEE